MIVRAKTTSVETGQGTYAVRMKVGDHELVGDEPISAGGDGLGPAPFELLTAALAECTSMTLRWYAQQHGWSLEKVVVEVEFERRMLVSKASPTDVFTKRVYFNGNALNTEQIERLRDLVDRCPIQRLLEGTPDIRTKLIHDDATSLN